MKVIEEEQRVRVMEAEWTPLGVIQEIVDSGVQEDPFYVMDLGEVVRRYHQWKELMPRVEPFYGLPTSLAIYLSESLVTGSSVINAEASYCAHQPASMSVKCNDDKLLVSTLAALGAGFDCASKQEIELITSIGVQPDRIIFANPAKMASHIRYGASKGVDTMTFDSEIELMKIKQLMPNAKLVIRVRCDASSAQCPLGIKFGCDPVIEAPRLLKLAAVMAMDVVGVSFHVGSGASETAVYGRAIRLCHALFSLGANVGHNNMTLLDIGGGFPGATDSTIQPVAAVINAALEAHFPDQSVRIIAEPGRYFAAAAYTLATMIHAKREVSAKEGKEGEEETHTMYFINDGVYGSFNCVLYDHQHVHATPLTVNSEKALPSSIWGPSCDGLDCVLPTVQMPPMAIGEWLVWKDMGAYTLPVASAFNGYPVPRVRAVIDHRLWSMLKNLWPLTESHFIQGCGMTGPQTPPASPPPLELNHRAVFVECALK